MKRLLPLSVFLAALSLMAGFLLSRMSFVGRIGISLFYKEYTFMKTWWKGTLVIFMVLFLLMLLQDAIDRKLVKKRANSYHLLALTAAAVGMYFTYRDFQYYYMHRWLKEKFHLGGYLFWIGWIGISLFFLFGKQEKPSANENLPAETSDKLQDQQKASKSY
ncbi:cytochrome d ubiquinol oxidase subunit II [Pinibacter soli]|uniref:Cytochrome d ubiquinol oxidase subunit II n=1 Tax=Pinibacter soli TaxID=3044211 RepID=A0ABT6RC47_9BACT|nr:cytochrome d ubiquinol oxidase subunit II [Pinibacter soli]MDI3320137.1 cytochrome d ubiquinol oxidase subunit II [Pinibacter soli]